MAKYYLINGTPNNAQILTLPNEVSWAKEFDDISEIDIITTKIPAGKAAGTLKVYNEELLRGSSLIMEYPVKKTKGLIYRPFFDESVDEKSKKRINEFRNYSFERYERVQAKKNNSKISVELDRTSKFDSFVYGVLYDILYGRDQGMTDLDNYNYLLSRDLRTQLLDVKDGVVDLDRDFNRISRTLTNYKSLRNLLMEYIHMYGTGKGGLKPDVDKYTAEYVNGRAYCIDAMVQNAIKDMENHQMTLDECMRLKRGR